MEIQALQSLIDQRRAQPFVALEDNVEDFLAAVDREAQIAERLDQGQHDPGYRTAT